nr:nucleocapsid protein [Paris yunnanensis betanucleorhabdovirus 1]
MSRITLHDLQKVRPSYASLPVGKIPENPSGQCPYIKYSFHEAVRSPIYKIAGKSNEEIVSFYSKISASEYREMSERDFYDFILVALSLKSPVTGGNVFSSPPYDIGMLCPDYNEASPGAIGSVSFRSPISSGVIQELVPSSGGTDVNRMDEDENITTKAQAISFLFSWMTRFFIKSPSDALNTQYDKVKSTFMKFYQSSSTIFDKFRPDRTWIQGIKDASDTFLRVKNTLIFHVASSETFYKDNPKVFNVLRYLYYQNLEFMGMHAYVSIVSIMAKVALPPAQILSWLRIGGAELAIDEAFAIMSSLDNGMIQDGQKAERLWKYARCINQGYFNRLQTAYCAELISMLSHIEVNLGLSPETGYASPLNIYAIANNRHIKEIGKMKAEAFMMCKNSIVSLSEDASVVDKMYAESQGAKIQEGARAGPSSQPIIQNTPMEVEEPSRKRMFQEAIKEPRSKKQPPNLVDLPNVPE